eukprot:356891-Chlamydomonas_euryale.AAC.6
MLLWALTRAPCAATLRAARFGPPVPAAGKLLYSYNFVTGGDGGAGAGAGAGGGCGLLGALSALPQLVAVEALGGMAAEQVEDLLRMASKVGVRVAELPAGGAFGSGGDSGGGGAGARQGDGVGVGVGGVARFVMPDRFGEGEDADRSKSNADPKDAHPCGCISLAGGVGGWLRGYMRVRLCHGVCGRMPLSAGSWQTVVEGCSGLTLSGAYQRS